jgi:hypothetical protein
MKVLDERNDMNVIIPIPHQMIYNESSISES